MLWRKGVTPEVVFTNPQMIDAMCSSEVIKVNPRFLALCSVSPFHEEAIFCYKTQSSSCVNARRVYSEREVAISLRPSPEILRLHSLLPGRLFYLTGFCLEIDFRNFSSRTKVGIVV